MTRVCLGCLEPRPQEEFAVVGYRGGVLSRRPRCRRCRQSEWTWADEQRVFRGIERREVRARYGAALAARARGFGGEAVTAEWRAKAERMARA